MLTGKVMTIHLTVGFMKNVSLYKMSYHPEQYIHIRNKIKVELDLSNYGTKADLKGATCIDTSEFAKKVNLASLKSGVEKLCTEALHQRLLFLCCKN